MDMNRLSQSRGRDVMSLLSELFLLAVFCLALWYVAGRMYKSIQAGKKGRGCGGCPGCSRPDHPVGGEDDYSDENDPCGNPGNRE
jgi:hypothetical protein